MRIAFDIDDTLIVPSVATGFERDTPNYETIALLMWFWRQGHEIILWSGSGTDWAMTWGEKLGIPGFTVLVKEKRDDIDICFDDCVVDLAKVNIRVKRINNGISRAEWNLTKREPAVVFPGTLLEIDRAKVPSEDELKKLGFIFADGRELKKKEYPKLYSVIKGVYGESEEGFNIPDFRESKHRLFVIKT